MSGDPPPRGSHSRPALECIDRAADDPRVTGSAMLVLVKHRKHADSRTGESRPSMESIVSATGLNVRAVHVARALLVELGYLDRVVAGNRGTTAVYRLIGDAERVHAGAPIRAERVHEDAPFRSRKGARERRERVHADAPRTRETEPGTNTSTPSSSTNARDEHEHAPERVVAVTTNGQVVMGEVVDAAPAIDEPGRLFAYWRERVQVEAPGSAVALTARRRRLIQARLAEGYTPETLRAAVDGLFVSRWHRERHAWGLEHVVKSGEAVERLTRDASAAADPASDPTVRAWQQAEITHNLATYGTVDPPPREWWPGRSIGNGNDGSTGA